MIKANPTIPPTTPPAIAPTFVFLLPPIFAAAVVLALAEVFALLLEEAELEVALDDGEIVVAKWAVVGVKAPLTWPL